MVERHKGRRGCVRGRRSGNEERQENIVLGGGPRVVVSTAAFQAKVQGLFPSLGILKETRMFLPHPLVKLSIVVSLRDREVVCSASDLQGLNFESCVRRAVSSHYPQGVLLTQFNPLSPHNAPKHHFTSLKTD